MAYTPYLWKNLPDETTPISAENLNHMEQGIADAHSLAADLETDKANEITSFTEASERANIASGETITVILGKIKKFFTDLKTVAFSGSYEDLSDQPTIPEIDDTTTSVSDLWSSSKTSDELADKMSYGDNGILGAKNLLPCNATSQVINGVTFTVNDDGSITASGIASADTSYPITTISKPAKVFENSYIATGCPSGGGSSTYRIQLVLYKDGSWVGNSYVGPDGYSLVVGSGGWNINQVIANILVYNGTDLTTPITFYPMLRLATDTDSTYQPYSMTNKQLTEEVREIEEVNDITGEIITNTTFDASSFFLKQSKVVNLSLRFTVDTDYTSYALLATLPSEASPKKNIWFKGWKSSTGTDVWLLLNSSGGLYCTGALTSGTEVITQCITFIA